MPQERFQSPSFLNLFPIDQNKRSSDSSSANPSTATPLSDAALTPAAPLQETHQEAPILPHPTLRDFVFTLLPPPERPMPSAARTFFSKTSRIRDFFPAKNPQALDSYAELIIAGRSLSLSSLPMKRKPKKTRIPVVETELIRAGRFLSLSPPSERLREIFLRWASMEPDNASPNSVAQTHPTLRDFVFTLLPPPERPITALISFFPEFPTLEHLSPVNNTGISCDRAELTRAAASLSLSLPEITITEQLLLHGGPNKTQNSMIETELRSKNQWYKKQLSISDMNSRLLLGADYLENSVFPSMDDQSRAACHTPDGLSVKILDLDTKTEHHLTLNKLQPYNFNLTNDWKTEFARRRGLEQGDTIDLFWNSDIKAFSFRTIIEMD